MARQTPVPPEDIHPRQLGNKLCHQLALTSPTVMLPRKFTTRTTPATATLEPWIEQDLNGGKSGKRLQVWWLVGRPGQSKLYTRPDARYQESGSLWVVKREIRDFVRVRYRSREATISKHNEIKR